MFKMLNDFLKLWQMRKSPYYRPGRDKLWGWFGLSYASFLTLPRVLMHEMPDEWQGQMAELLQQYDDAHPNMPDNYIQVRCSDLRGRLIKFPSWMLNYRYPDYDKINEIKAVVDCVDTHFSVRSK